MKLAEVSARVVRWKQCRDDQQSNKLPSFHSLLVAMILGLPGLSGDHFGPTEYCLLRAYCTHFSQQCVQCPVTYW